MICVDQWRGDCLGSEGHPVIKTPYLDQLAAGGVSFESAFSACPSCIAARASLLTGMSPVKCGRVGYKDGVTWNYKNTLPSVFADNDYHCQSIGKMHVYPERNKIGFHDVILHDGYLHFSRKKTEKLEDIDDYLAYLRKETGRADADYFEHGVDCNSYIARPWDKAEYLHPTNYVTARSVDYIRSRRENSQPFFLFTSYHRPHPPYDPPQWAFDLYMQREMPPPSVGNWSEFLSRYANLSPSSPYAKLDSCDIKRAKSGYYGHMTHIDHQINRIMEALEEAHKVNTIIVFLSDHGELLGDHNLFRKSLPYEGSARIPLIFRGPGIERNNRPDAVAALHDVMPTLLELSGIPIPGDVDGKSLASVMRGKGAAVRRYLHGEHTYGEQSVHFITDGEWKYIWWSGDGREQLFNRKNDPYELHEVSGSSPDNVSLMRGELIRVLAGRPEGYSDGKNLFTGRHVESILPWAENGRKSENDAYKT